jgi:hypothetical protein
MSTISVPSRTGPERSIRRELTRVAYDLPSALMSGLDDANVAEAARKLDAKLIAVAETISGATV